MRELFIEQLVKQYIRLVYKICLDLLGNVQDAEEQVQETFLSIFIHSERYKNLSDVELKNLICKIALNKCKDHLKSKETRMRRITDAINEEMDCDSDLEREALKQEESQEILETINELKSPYREILNDFYIKQMKIDEIAKVKRVDSSIIKVQLHRAREKIKQKILEKGGEHL